MTDGEVFAFESMFPPGDDDERDALESACDAVQAWGRSMVGPPPAGWEVGWRCFDCLGASWNAALRERGIEAIGRDAWPADEACSAVGVAQ